MKPVKFIPYNALKSGIPGRIPVVWCDGLSGAQLVCCVFTAMAVKSHKATWASTSRITLEFKMI